MSIDGGIDNLPGADFSITTVFLKLTVDPNSSQRKRSSPSGAAVLPPCVLEDRSHQRKRDHKFKFSTLQ